MSIDTHPISVKGRIIQVPCLRLGGACVVATGKSLRTAVIHDEEWLTQAEVGDPLSFLDPLKSHRLQADIFSFSQRIPDTTPHYPYPYEWDNSAIIHITSYKDWWDKLSQESRRNSRLAAKRGVTVQVVPFDDTLVQGIAGIYNEAPIRLGKPFWHYGKSLETVKAENGTYVDRSEFIGAFFEGQLIGFIKIVYVDQIGSMMQILSMIAHQDKRTTNALINKAVEVCAGRQIPYLKYCKFIYGVDETSQLTEFKRRNGFEPVRFPQYFIPLTARGRLAMKLRVHHGIKGCLPPAVFGLAQQLRTKYYHFKDRQRRELAAAKS
jgi:hypothetical protein